MMWSNDCVFILAALGIIETFDRRLRSVLAGIVTILGLAVACSVTLVAMGTRCADHTASFTFAPILMNMILV